MKIVIIGAGLTGLYIGYLLKNINMDFEIYEKSSRPGGKLKTIKGFDTDLECGESLIQPYHFNVIKLINKLKLKTSLIKGRKLISMSNHLDEFVFNLILNKILSSYHKNKPSNISAYIYIQSILTSGEYKIFKSYIFDDTLLQNEISDFMKYNFYDLKLTNCYRINPKIKNCTLNNFINVVDGTQSITDKLAKIVQQNLYLDHSVQEITYMPITGTYLLMINDRYVQADKVIFASNASISKIRLNIPKEIMTTIFNIKPVESFKLFTLHEKSFDHLLPVNNIIQTQSIFTNITPVTKKILSMSYIFNSKADLLYKMISDKTTPKSHIINILNKLLTNISSIEFPPIVDYMYCYWTYSHHINTKKIKTNFWNKYNLILAGEWVHPYHNTIEASCMSAIDTFNIINDTLFIDKLKHKSDNVRSIEEARKK